MSATCCSQVILSPLPFARSVWGKEHRVLSIYTQGKRWLRLSFNHLLRYAVLSSSALARLETTQVNSSICKTRRFFPGLS